MPEESLVFLPQPRSLQLSGGELKLGGDFVVFVQDRADGELGRLGGVAAEVFAGFGMEAAPGEEADGRPTISISLAPREVEHSQGYRLVVAPQGVAVIGHDPAGAFYGLMTLKQLLRQCQHRGALPALRIDDHPDFPHRGVMQDISRDKVPTMETLYALIDRLAEWKINQFQLYMEHTFAYEGHEEVWREASPMTAEEVRALDAYCRERFIELVPNQNSFGHFERWLKHERYRHLAETPAGYALEHDIKRQAYTLCPTDPGSVELLDELYGQLLPNFESELFNVGCDETWELGEGRSREEAERVGKGRLYLDFLLKIHGLSEKHGRRMQFWGDIILKYPELIAEVPRDAIALMWGYEYAEPFAGHCFKFANAGLEFYVCPGTSAWNSLTGRAEVAWGNLLTAAINGRQFGASGYLITDWGDNGHWQQRPVSWFGFSYGAALSWCLETNAPLDYKSALGRHVLEDPEGEAGYWLWEMGQLFKRLGREIFNQTHFSQWLAFPEHEMAPTVKPEGIERVLAGIESLEGRLGGLTMNRPDAELIKDEVRMGLAMARHACHLGQARLGVHDGRVESIPGERRAELEGELRGLLPEYERLWLASNRPGGLKDSVGRLTRVMGLYEGSGD